VNEESRVIRSHSFWGIGGAVVTIEDLLEPNREKPQKKFVWFSEILGIYLIGRSAVLRKLDHSAPVVASAVRFVSL
jgi:hypothetical protein